MLERPAQVLAFPLPGMCYAVTSPDAFGDSLAALDVAFDPTPAARLGAFQQSPYMAHLDDPR
ncbi:MAG: hypothetical protein Kow0060_07720 [Methylohalobius crimeensis]